MKGGQGCWILRWNSCKKKEKKKNIHWSLLATFSKDSWLSYTTVCSKTGNSCCTGRRGDAVTKLQFPGIRQNAAEAKTTLRGEIVLDPALKSKYKTDKVTLRSKIFAMLTLVLLHQCVSCIVCSQLHTLHCLIIVEDVGVYGSLTANSYSPNEGWILNGDQRFHFFSCPFTRYI